MDVIARVIGDQLMKDLKQPVIVDNRPGAGGGIGVQALLNAPADGPGDHGHLEQRAHGNPARDENGLRPDEGRAPESPPSRSCATCW
jgi:hypothetical protein